jgi:uncharacterized protein YejL (UPF0352 family)
MKKYCKELLVFSLVITIFLSLTGCSLFSKNNTANQDTKVKNEAKKEAPQVNQDVKKTEQLKKEKEISNGQVYVQNNMVVATMLIKDNISEADAKALAEKYAKQLKEEHKDMKVNVQAVQKGKNIANITIEK